MFYISHVIFLTYSFQTWYITWYVFFKKKSIYISYDNYVQYIESQNDHLRWQMDNRYFSLTFYFFNFFYLFHQICNSRLYFQLVITCIHANSTLTLIRLKYRLLWLWSFACIGLFRQKSKSDKFHWSLENSKNKQLTFKHAVEQPLITKFKVRTHFMPLPASQRWPWLLYK